MSPSGKVKISTAFMMASIWFGTHMYADEFVLIKDGVAKSVVVMSEDATPPEHHAAEELCFFLNKITKADVEISTMPVREKYSIWLGTLQTNPQIAKSGLAKQVASLSEQGFILNSDSNGLIIAGKTPTGVLFGTYAFLEEHLGMRWFFPGEAGEYCPSKSSLDIGRITEVQNPDFSTRQMGFDATRIAAKMVDTWNWLARNRMQSSLNETHYEEYVKRGAKVVGGGHIMTKMIPDILFDEHPEYFGFYDGKRQKLKWRRQPCTTNPEVIELAAQYMLAWFNENPNGTFQVMNNDWPYFCECGNCVQCDLKEEVERGYGGRLSTRWFTFLNKISQKVWKVKPDAEILTIGYQDFRLPPLGVVPDNRLTVMLCDHDRCFRHAINNTDCQANLFFRNMFENWARMDVARANFTYYNTGISRGPQGKVIIVRPMERVMESEIRYMYNLGHRYWYHKTFPPDGDYGHSKRRYDTPAVRDYWRANFQMHYLMAKLTWNLDIDVDALIRDMNEKFYGPAGDAMYRFREKLLDLWDEAPGHSMYGSQYLMSYANTLVAPGAVNILIGLLDEAKEAVANNEKYLNRVKKDCEIFQNTWLRAYREYKERPMDDIWPAKRNNSITIDGKLDEPDWKSCKRITGFRNRKGESAEAQTYVRLLYDKTYFYIGLEMEEPAIEHLVADTLDSDNDRIFNDDTVELFIDPSGGQERGGARYVHLTVNPAGTLRDSEILAGESAAGNVDYNTRAKLAVSVDDGKWTLEIKVPTESIGGVIREGKRWLMDVGRVRRAGDKSETSTWWDGSFHSPDSFRSVIFAKEVIRNGRFEHVLTADSEELLERFRQSGWEYGNAPPKRFFSWMLHGAYPGKITVCENDAFAGSNALKMEGTNCAIFQNIDAELTAGKKLQISFAARGKGKLLTSIYHYRVDTETGSQKYVDTTAADKIDLRTEWKCYQIAYKHSAEKPELARLAFQLRNGWILIDDVYVSASQ